MPDKLPIATPEQRELAARDSGKGFDTEVAIFFGACDDPDVIPTEIDGGTLGKTARERSRERALAAPPVLK